MATTGRPESSAMALPSPMVEPPPTATAQSASVNGLRLGGGANGSGGAIDFTLDADVQTTGAGAVGIAVQSIGGGGGFISSIGSSIDAPLMVGATDGATGDGGAVKVATHGIIQTSGAGSTGLIVQRSDEHTSERQSLMRI